MAVMGHGFLMENVTCYINPINTEHISSDTPWDSPAPMKRPMAISMGRVELPMDLFMEVEKPPWASPWQLA